MLTFEMILGISLLVLGGRFLSLAFGGVGFLVGYLLAGYLLKDQPILIHLLVSAAMAVLTIFLAASIQKTAVGLAGFAAGSYLSYAIINLLKANSSWLFWGLIFAGGLLGALLMTSLVHWGMILLTTLAGSFLVVHDLPIDARLLALTFLILAFIGFGIQITGFRFRRKPRIN